MAEIIFFIFILFVLRAFFVMLRCPNCKTLKSILLQKQIKKLDEDGRQQIHCKACNYSWKRTPSYGVGGG
jgi:transposase-like protein